MENDQMVTRTRAKQNQKKTPPIEAKTANHQIRIKEDSQEDNSNCNSDSQNEKHIQHRIPRIGMKTKMPNSTEVADLKLASGQAGEEARLLKPTPNESNGGSGESQSLNQAATSTAVHQDTVPSPETNSTIPQGNNVQQQASGTTHTTNARAPATSSTSMLDVHQQARGNTHTGTTDEQTRSTQTINASSAPVLNVHHQEATPGTDSTSVLAVEQEASTATGSTSVLDVQQQARRTTNDHTTQISQVSASSSLTNGASNINGQTSQNKESIVKGQSTSPKKYMKKKKSVSSQKLNKSQYISVYVSKIYSGDMVMWMEKNGKPPYVQPVLSYLRNDSLFTTDILKIDGIYNQVSSNDPNCFKEQMSKTGYKNRYPVFVSTLDESQVRLNCGDTRQRWANNFIKFFNNPVIQGKFAYPTKAEFGGDVTPQKNNIHPPHLSRFLTLDGTMTVCRGVLSGNSPLVDFSMLSSIEEVLQETDLVNDYFHPEILPLVQERFRSETSHNQSEEENSNDIQLDQFQFTFN